MLFEGDLKPKMKLGSQRGWEEWRSVAVVPPFNSTSFRKQMLSKNVLFGAPMAPMLCDVIGSAVVNNHSHVISWTS